MMRWAIETERLAKIYPQAEGGFWRKSRPAAPSVQDVSLQIPPGELFGLIGPNGAGKTTLAKMLCTLISPTAGRAMVAGYPLGKGRAIRAAVGLVVTDERSFYWRLTGRQNLRFFAALHGLFGRAAETRIAALLADLDLVGFAGRRFSAYSSGMRQRLAIARALLHQPRILFLDEPTRSLDPAAARDLHSLIHRLRREGNLTIFLITHDLGEAEALCERVAIMDRGRIRAIGRPADLRRGLRRPIRYQVRLSAFDEDARAVLARRIPHLQLEKTVGQQEVTLRFEAVEGEPVLADLLDLLRVQGQTILTVEGESPGLDDVFNRLTEQSADEPDRRA